MEEVQINAVNRHVLEAKVEEEIKKALKNLKEYESKDANWKIIENETNNKINLYEIQSKKDNKYLLKVQGLLNCEAEQLLKLNTDNFYETRKQWDDPDLKGIEQILSFPDKKINIVRYWIEIPVPLVWDRDFLGIQYVLRIKKSGTIILVFQTIPDSFLQEYIPDFPTTASLDRVAAIGTTILKIKPYNKKSIHATIYTHIDPGGWIPSAIVPLYKEKLRERVCLYEKVCQEQYAKIYKAWKCEKCSEELKKEITQDVNTEKCRRCLAAKE